MEIIKVENLSFNYPECENKALDNINLSISKGDFVTVCGKSGCGKTTLLRLLKTCLSPFGILSGNVFFEEKILSEIDSKEQAMKIGFVMQNPDNQIVTDKVWHELAFGLESIGLPNEEIRVRVSEMASFFGIENWFHKNVTELSGGQKQLLNLASVMAMQPSLLILDEPTSQLDPIAAGEFLNTLEKINRELGTTVILSEHRLEEAFHISDKVIVMDKGIVIAEDKPEKIGRILKEKNHDMYEALPTPVKVYEAVSDDENCPVTVREGRVWLEEYCFSHPPKTELISKDINDEVEKETVVELNDVWFRYEKESPDVIKGLNLKVKKGELFALVGGNGTGKSTALSLISALNRPYRGRVLIKGKEISKLNDFHGKNLGMLPQNPQSIFVKKTVYKDLLEILKESSLSKEEKELKVQNTAALCQIDNLLSRHPYDLSGGEGQRAALAKILLLSPEILLLDEPTKGLDAHFKLIFADILAELKAKGVTVILVSHDIEFCAEYADRCALMFDGNITSEGKPGIFFGGKNFYTTAANRMARTTIPEALLPGDIIKALGGKVKKREKTDFFDNFEKVKEIEAKKEKKKIPFARIIVGALFALLFILTSITSGTDFDVLGVSNYSFITPKFLKAAMVFEIMAAFIAFFPDKKIGTDIKDVKNSDGKLAKRTLISATLIFLAIPLTMYLGIKFFGGRKYYFTSLLMLFETMIPFFMVFESRKPKARELVIISVLCAIAVVGRTAFFALPQFKPVVALVILAGICFGGETGFLVGAVTGFISNFFFGQGPYTPWQMFSFGIIGFLAGVLFKKGLLRRTRVSLCIFGFLVTLIIYGGIMNPAAVIMWQNKITKEMLISSYIAGLPMDIIHSLSTVFFLWFMAEPMIDKFERVKIKYGLIR